MMGSEMNYFKGIIVGVVSFINAQILVIRYKIFITKDLK